MSFENDVELSSNQKKNSEFLLSANIRTLFQKLSTEGLQ